MNRIEDDILGLADVDNRRVCVFTGPVFTASDMVIINIQGELPIRIPAGFWKVAILRHNSELCAAAFLLWQCDIRSGEPVPFDPVLEQVRVNTVEYLAGLFFDDVVRQADPIRFDGPNSACTIRDVDDIIL